MRVSKRNTLSPVISIIIIYAGIQGLSAPVQKDRISSVILSVRNYIQNKNYNRAFKILDDFDSQNNNLEILALKIELALNYSVKNIMNKSFAFADLKPDEKLEDYSICPQCFTDVSVYDLQIENILLAKIKGEPGNGHVSRLLGDYYFFVYKHSEESQKMTAAELMKKIDAYYAHSEERGSATAASCDNHAIILMVQKRFKEAIAVLQKGLALNSNYCNSLYNIAYAYYMHDDSSMALKSAKKSFSCFSEAAGRADTAVLIAQIFEKQEDNENSYVYYTSAWHLGRNDFFCGKKLLMISLKIGRQEDPLKNAARLLMLDIYNLEYYHEIIDLFLQYKRNDQLEHFFEKLEKAFKDDPRVMGNIYVSRAGLVFRLDQDAHKRKEYLKKARKKYREYYPEDHEVLLRIDRELK